MRHCDLPKSITKAPPYRALFPRTESVCSCGFLMRGSLKGYLFQENVWSTYAVYQVRCTDNSDCEWQGEPYLIYVPEIHSIAPQLGESDEVE